MRCLFLRDVATSALVLTSSPDLDDDVLASAALLE
jgi:hypothetical protein